jgi:hypothetical protein
MTDDTPDLGADAFAHAQHAVYPQTHDGQIARYQEFRTLFSTDAGKRVLAEILRLGNAGRNSAKAGLFDTNRTFYNEGMRGLAHEIYDLCHRLPERRPTHANSKPPLEKR